MADLVTVNRPAEPHADLAKLIETGEADCRLGLQSAAGHHGFIPLVADESFDLPMTRRDYFEPPIQTLLAFARSDIFVRRAEHLRGYDLTSIGQVLCTRVDEGPLHRPRMGAELAAKGVNGVLVRLVDDLPEDGRTLLDGEVIEDGSGRGVG